jgi:anaerobic selenocysteine-containing dehydrogenase
MGTLHLPPYLSCRPLALDARDQPTVCVLCSHTCGIRVDVEGGKIKAVRADESNPISGGYVCNKASSVARSTHHDQRVTTPLRRGPDGELHPVSWDDAIREIAARLGEIRRRHGGRSIALVGVGGQANHMDAPYAIGFLQGLGSRRWFNAYAQEKTQNHLVDGWLFQASPGAFFHGDTEACGYLLVLGTNPKVSNRGRNANEALRAFGEKTGRRLVVVDPRETETARGAQRHLRIRPGSDCYLLLAMAAQIVQEGLLDRAFLEAWARDTDVVVRLLRGLDVGALLARTGLEEALVREETRLFARAQGASILWDLGIEHGRFSTLNAYLIRLLAVLTGNLGRPGGMHFLESFNPPGSGKERGSPERALASGIPGIRALGNFAMFSPSLFPEEVLIDHPERIRAALVEGANPLVSYADTPRWREAFRRLELKVVIDPALTETAREADFVLPAPTGYEKWEVCAFPTGFPEIKAQLRPPVVPAPPQAIPEPEIYARLAEAMDLFGEPPAALRTLAKVATHPAGAAPFLATLGGAARIGGARGKNGTQNRMIFWAYRTLGPHLESPALVAPWLICHANAFARREAVLRVLGEGWRRRGPFALAAELFRRLMDHPEGAILARLDTTKHLERAIGHEDGKIHLAPAPMMAEIARALASADEVTEAFPLVLAAGLRTHWTANTIQRDPAWRRGKGPHCPLGMAPATAAALGVISGERVRLRTARAAVEIEVQIDGRLPPGFLSVPNGFGLSDGVGPPDGLNANELTSAEHRDPFTGCPQHKHVPCRVEKLTPAG